MLREAVEEMSFLLTRDYADKAALKLVGDHHQLTQRQRRAVLRAACSDQSLARRKQTRVSPCAAEGAALIVDGYNVLIFVESALSGGILLHCRDGCMRDMASLHGSYRRVEETEPAVRVMGRALERIAPARVEWLLDAPVSNSGRLAESMRAIADEHEWPWEVHPVDRVDRRLAQSPDVVLTSDSWILDRAGRWLDGPSLFLAEADVSAHFVDLAP